MSTLSMTASDLHTKYHLPPERSSDLLYARHPVVRVAPIVSNGQHLNHAINLSVDDPELEPLQGDLANIGRSGDLEALRCLNGLANSAHGCLVIAAPEARILLFVVSDLPFMLQCRFWVEPEGHFN